MNQLVRKIWIWIMVFATLLCLTAPVVFANDSFDFEELLGTAKPVAITFQPIRLTEETGGQWVTDPANSENTYYQYDWQSALAYTVTFSNDVEKDFTSTRFSYLSRNFSLSFTDSQSFQTPWLPGNTYTIAVSVGDAVGTVEVTVEAEQTAMPGDFDGDGLVTNTDVIHLLWYTMFPEDYPITINGDFDGDGLVTNTDVVHLLWHTMYPGSYPLGE